MVEKIPKELGIAGRNGGETAPRLRFIPIPAQLAVLNSSFLLSILLTPPRPSPTPSGARMLDSNSASTH